MKKMLILPFKNRNRASCLKEKSRGILYILPSEGTNTIHTLISKHLALKNKDFSKLFLMSLSISKYKNILVKKCRMHLTLFFSTYTIRIQAIHDLRFNALTHGLSRRKGNIT